MDNDIKTIEEIQNVDNIMEEVNKMEHEIKIIEEKLNENNIVEEVKKIDNDDIKIIEEIQNVDNIMEEVNKMERDIKIIEEKLNETKIVEEVKKIDNDDIEIIEEKNNENTTVEKVDDDVTIMEEIYNENKVTEEMDNDVKTIEKLEVVNKDGNIRDELGEEGYMALKRKHSMEVCYYSNACHVCRRYGEHIKLKRCGSCKVVAYCSRAHQKEHWPTHKEFCRCVCKLNKDPSTSMYSWNSKENQDDPQSICWYKFRLDMVENLEDELGRTLKIYELHAMLFPRSCLVCHEVEHEKLIDCPHCPSTSFCAEHLNTDHQRRCEVSRFAFTLESMGLYQAEPLWHVNIPLQIPKDMRQVVRRYQTACSFAETEMTRAQWHALISSHLSMPYTLLHVIQKLSLPRNNVNIHIIGADKVVNWNNIDHWEILLHHVKTLRELRVTFFGPDLDADAVCQDLCENCIAKNGTVIVQSIGSYYHDYSLSKEYVNEPTVIAGFNLELGDETEELDYNAWPSIFHLVKNINCPFVMTSHSLEQKQVNEARINEILETDVKPAYSGRNPYTSLRPCRHDITEEFCYCNEFLTIYEKLK